MRRYVIIGSGIAGLSAAEAIRARDEAGEIVMVSDERHRFYSRPGLAYLLNRTLPERQLRVRTAAEIAGLRLDRRLGRAEQVDPSGHRVVVGGESLSYDRLLIATGARSVPPPWGSAGLDGMIQLDGLDDARALIDRARRGRDAVVVGGGPTAIELVDGLLARGVRTRYFLRGDRYWSSVLDEVESALVRQRLEAAGAVVHTRTEIVRPLISGGRVVGVETSAGDRLPCDLLCVAIGVRPRDELAGPARQPGGGLRVDPSMCAGGDVYAAGDVARVIDPATGESRGDVLWSVGLEQGRVAGANMAGASLVYERGVPLNVTRLAGLTTTIIGEVGEAEDDDLVALSRGESGRWRRRPKAWVVVDRHGFDRLRLIAADRRLIGAVVMGDQGLSRPIARAVRDRRDLSPVWDALRADPDRAVARLLDFIDRPEAGSAARLG